MEFFILLALVWFVALIFSRGFISSTKSQPAPKKPPPIKAEKYVYSTFSDPDQSGWVEKDRLVIIAGQSIMGGLFYMGEYLTSVSGWSSEPALVNPSLEVDFTHIDRTGWGVRRWPSYSELSPSARAAFLRWLQSDRTDTSIYIGYIWLYFFGLERRIFSNTETSTDPRAETQLICDEVIRLVVIYSKELSFTTQAIHFVDFISTLLNLDEPTLDKIQQSLVCRGFTLRYQVKIGRLVASGKPLDALIALEWVRQDPENQKIRSFIEGEDFSQLFLQRYSVKYPAGLYASINANKLKLEYIPSNPSFRGPVCITLDNTPDVASQVDISEQLSQVAEDCVNQLMPLRIMQKKYPQYIDIVNSVFKTNSHQKSKVFTKLKSFLSTKLQQEQTTKVDAKLVVKLSFGEQAEPDIVNTAIFYRALEHAGFGYEPDPRFNALKTGLIEDIVVFKLGALATFTPTVFYSVACLFVQILAVASDTGLVNRNEIISLIKHVATVLQLNQDEKLRLRASFQWLSHQAELLANFRSRIISLDPAINVNIGHFLISILISRGAIEPSTIMALTRVQRALGLDLKAMRETSVLFPRDFKRAKSQDIAKIKHIVASLFQKDVQVAIQQKNSATEKLKPFASELMLSEKQLIQTAMNRKFWSMRELKEHCAVQNMLCEGLLEHSNHIAFKRYEINVFEGADPIEIDLEAAKKVLQ